MNDRCCSNEPAYVVTYSAYLAGKTLNVCLEHWEQEKDIKSIENQKTSLKFFQVSVEKLVCTKCKTVVTKQMGCPCHAKKEVVA